MRIAVVPAFQEAVYVSDTVSALRELVDRVVVADDGSMDATAEQARSAGARVLRRHTRGGKGTAAEAGVRSALRSGADVVLLADADLGATATGLAPLAEMVDNGELDLAIGVLPPRAVGGFGLVRDYAADAIYARTGWRPEAPLSGQRALTAAAAASCLPFAGGFGLETAMTIDAFRLGLRVSEVPTDVSHRPTGRTPSGFAHRARQGIDIRAALRTRR